MSYSYDDQSLRAVGVVYLIFGIGCIVFFLGGVCALLCCCNQRFRGIERKGYILRNAEQNAPLIAGQGQGIGGVPTAPGWVAGYPPTENPPPYGTSPQSKY